MTSLLNFIKIYHLVQKLSGGQIHRQKCDLISIFFPFRKESRLKTVFATYRHLMAFLKKLDTRNWEA
jgi:hypothetical protein